MSEKHKPKKEHRAKKDYVILVLVLGIIAIAIALIWSHFRYEYYKYQSRTAFSNEIKSLKDPLDTLGFNGVTNEPTKCSSETIYGYSKPQLQCITTHSAYVVLAQNQNSKNTFVAKATELDQLLSQNGWTETRNAAPSISQ